MYWLQIKHQDPILVFLGWQTIHCSRRKGMKVNNNTREGWLCAQMCCMSKYCQVANSKGCDLLISSC